MDTNGYRGQKMTRKKKRHCNERHPGLTDAARALDIGYAHLWRVVTGRRKSRSLLKAYRAWRRELKRQQRAARKTTQ